jgi:transposase-like protein
LETDKTLLLLRCPNCNSSRYVKNGTSHGRRKNKCLDCGGQFSTSPRKPRIKKETWKILEKLLDERLSLEAIARVTKVSVRHL